MSQRQVIKFSGTVVGYATCIQRTAEATMHLPALRVIVENRKASTSLLQRRLKVGYGRAAAMLDSMERQGLIGPIDGGKPRQVLGRAHELVNDWDEQGI